MSVGVEKQLNMSQLCSSHKSSVTKEKYTKYIKHVTHLGDASKQSIAASPRLASAMTIS